MKKRSRLRKAPQGCSKTIELFDDDYDFVLMADHLFDEAMVSDVRCGYDFVLVDRPVYTRALVPKLGDSALLRKVYVLLFIRMRRSCWLGRIHTRLRKNLEGVASHSFSY